MANTLLTPTMVTRKALMILHQKCAFIGTVERQYDDSFAKDGAKIGDTLKIRLPNRYTTALGSTITPQDTVETSVSLVVGSQRHVPMNFLASELTLSVDDFSERILDPAMAVLAAGAENDAFEMTKDVYQQVGTPGTTPTALLTYLQAVAALTDSLAPLSQRSIQLAPLASATIIDALKGLFHDSEAIVKQYRDGIMGRTIGLDWYANTLVNRVTNGNEVTGVTVGVSPLSGATLGLATITTGDTFLKGEIFTIANVFRVHPETKVSTGVLQQFAVRTSATSGGTTLTIDITPSIISTGADQNVNANAVAAAAIVFAGTASLTYTALLAYHKQAFAVAFADLYMPKGLDWGARETLDGISMRLIRDYDVTTDKIVTRADILYGVKTIRPELACRVASL